MTTPHDQAREYLEAARAHRPTLDPHRRAQLKQAVIAGVAGTAVAASSASAASGWFASAGAKVVIGLTAAAVGSGLTYGAMKVAAPRTGVTPVVVPARREAQLPAPPQPTADVPANEPVVEIAPVAEQAPRATSVEAAPSAPVVVAEVARPPRAEPSLINAPPSTPSNPPHSAPGLINPSHSAPGLINPSHSAPGLINPSHSAPGLINPTPSIPDPINPPPSTPDLHATGRAEQKPAQQVVTVPPSARNSSPSASALDEELVQLRKAMALHEAQDDSGAAAVLATYEERFPRGLLRVEALTLRVLVACARGRIDEANDVWRVLSTEAPHVLSTPRLQQSCAHR